MKVPKIDSLQKAKIPQNKFLFVDSITKSANPKAEDAANCMYCSSASALTELSLTIDKVIQTGKFDALLFDSLSTMLIYNKPGVVCKFVHNIINKIKAKKITAVFTALEGDTESDVLKNLGLFVDKVIHDS